MGEEDTIDIPDASELLGKKRRRWKIDLGSVFSPFPYFPSTHTKPNHPTNKSLSSLVVQLLQFQEEVFGKHVSNARSLSCQ